MKKTSFVTRLRFSYSVALLEIALTSLRQKLSASLPAPGARAASPAGTRGAAGSRALVRS